MNDTRSIYKDRLSRTRAMMRRQGVDGLYLTNIEAGHSENIWWLTGFAGSCSRCLITQNSMVLITDPRYENRAPREVEASGSGLLIHHKAEDIFAEIKKHNLKKIGLPEETHLGTFFKLQNKLADTQTELVLVEKVLGPDVEIDPLQEIQSIKSSTEIGTLGLATTAIELALGELFKVVRPGVSERELVFALEDLLPKGTLVSFPSIIGAGPNSAIAHYNVLDVAEGEERILEIGDAVQFDVGCVVGRYCSDISRVGVVGEPTDRQLAMYRAVKEATDAGIELYRPGVPMRDAYNKALEVVKAHRFDKIPHSLGHGVGMRVHEWPVSNSRIPAGAVFQEGQVVTCEPGIYIAGEGGMRIERMVLITKDGPELLDTHLSDELFVFPL